MSDPHATLYVDNVRVSLSAQQVKEAAQQLGITVIMPVPTQRRSNIAKGEYFRYLHTSGPAETYLSVFCGALNRYSEVSASGATWLERESGENLVERRTSFTT